MTDSSESSHSLAKLTDDDEHVFNSEASSDSEEHTSSYYGIPTHCWCGKRTVKLTSRTELNPSRLIYHCVKAARLQWRNDKHVFKWIDEGVQNELKKMEEKLKSFEGEMMNLKVFLEDVIKKDDRRGEGRENHYHSSSNEIKITLILFSLFALIMGCLIAAMYGY